MPVSILTPGVMGGSGTAVLPIPNWTQQLSAALGQLSTAPLEWLATTTTMPVNYVITNQITQTIMTTYTMTAGSAWNHVGSFPVPIRRAAPRTIEERVERKHTVIRRASARQRALSLLFDHLTDDQRDCFREHGHFHVQGGRSKTMYRIRDRTLVANVDVLSVDGRVSMRLCAHANANEIPMPDQLLAQKLMIEFNEDEFLRIANRHPAAVYG